MEGSGGAHRADDHRLGRRSRTPKRTSTSRAASAAARSGRSRRRARCRRRDSPRSARRCSTRRTPTGPTRSRSSASPPRRGSRTPEKNDDEALKLMRAAADLEASTEKHPVTPGAIIPARELLAEMLLESATRRCARGSAARAARGTQSPQRSAACCAGASQERRSGRERTAWVKPPMHVHVRIGYFTRRAAACPSVTSVASHMETCSEKRSDHRRA